MIRFCLLCGSLDRTELHHLSGRPSPDGAYYDLQLVIPLCDIPCHRGSGGVHQVLRAVGLDFLLPGAHPVAHRLRRVALHAELIADAGHPFTLAPQAARAVAVLLREAAEVIGDVR